MKKTSLRFKIADIFYIAMMIIPIIFGIVLKVLTTPASEGISITGARVYFTIPMPLQDFPVTESQVNSLIALTVVFFLCLFLTHGLTEKVDLKRQHLAEMAVQKVDELVKENMGEYFMGFTPFIIAILALSAVSSLLTLCGLFPPTSDINIVGGWAVLVFFLITFYKMKCGPLNYIKSFTQPVALLTPINLISEIATPVSMAFRHYGNVLSGSVISMRACPSRWPVRATQESTIWASTV
ncbi:MAG: F0F1 ATP synthase subunit A, partial [Clostridia bacterium]|nr:F0F1 ATP synthase subunit A [Clostridia bacterium]